MSARAKQSPVGHLPYELDYIPDDLRKRAKSELFEDEDTITHSLKLLKSRLNEEPDLRWQDEDLFLLSFLRARKFDVKRAFHLIKTWYTVMGKHDELYYNFNYDDVTRTIKENTIGYLPQRDKDGSVILIIRVLPWNYQVTCLGDVMRALTCALLHANLFESTQIAGFKVIVDMKGTTLKHLPHFSPSYLWLFTEALQNCFPGRFRAVHIVNENRLFTYVWNILKQFLSEKIKERFHFHGKNVEKLQKYFSPSILPAEFQGDLPPFDSTEWGKSMEKKADYMTHVFTFGYKKYKLKAQEKCS